MGKRIKFLEALQKFLAINPGNITPGTFLMRAHVLELIAQIYAMDDSDNTLDEIREIIEIYLDGEWEALELLKDIRRALILRRIEQQAEKPYWESAKNAMLEKVLREFMKTYLLGVEIRGLRKVISMINLLNLIRKAFEKDSIKTLLILATYMDKPLTKEKFIRQQLKEIINPPEPEPEPQTNEDEELPF